MLEEFADTRQDFLQAFSIVADTLGPGIKESIAHKIAKEKALHPEETYDFEASYMLAVAEEAKKLLFLASNVTNDIISTRESLWRGRVAEALDLLQKTGAHNFTEIQEAQYGTMEAWIK